MDRFGMQRAGRRMRRALWGMPVEAILLGGGLVAMAIMDPHGAHLVSFCPLDALGLSFCPGCGLGHAVAHLARGHWAASVQAHPLGIPAVLILLTHIGRLLHHAWHTAPLPLTHPPSHVERH